MLMLIGTLLATWNIWEGAGIIGKKLEGNAYGFNIAFSGDIEVDIYDSNGKHVGSNSYGGTDLEIPSMSYSLFPNQVIFVGSNNSLPVTVSITSNKESSVHIRLEDNKLDSWTHFYEYPEIRIVPAQTIKIEMNDTIPTIDFFQNNKLFKVLDAPSDYYCENTSGKKIACVDQ